MANKLAQASWNSALAHASRVSATGAVQSRLASQRLTIHRHALSSAMDHVYLLPEV
jgi:hypothetical protein